MDLEPIKLWGTKVKTTEWKSVKVEPGYMLVLTGATLVRCAEGSRAFLQVRHSDTSATVCVLSMGSCENSQLMIRLSTLGGQTVDFRTVDGAEIHVSGHLEVMEYTPGVNGQDEDSDDDSGVDMDPVDEDSDDDEDDEEDEFSGDPDEVLTAAQWIEKRKRAIRREQGRDSDDSAGDDSSEEDSDDERKIKTRSQKEAASSDEDPESDDAEEMEQLRRLEANKNKRAEKNRRKKEAVEQAKKEVQEQREAKQAAKKGKKREREAQAEAPREQSAKKHPKRQLRGGLMVQDVKIGEGPVVSRGRRLTMRYRGTLDNGKQFDGNMPRGKPFAFKLGAGEVIQGWDVGIAGMRVGGVRKLVIPSRMGYGARGSGPIPPNARLNFLVEVLSAR